ncbi:MAG TPA: HNH endonuclease family protein [Pseudonocardiaceae bacterium]|nr:HNH endonuclease family protein [Pseudonocardiaceae bacterium]
MITGRGIRRLFVPLLLSVVALVGLTMQANALPPGIPSATTALTQLNDLTVKPDGSMTGYARDKFPTWINIEGNCDTREEVLRRDGVGITVGTNCQPTAGHWVSPYNGITITVSSQVQIDHIVPLGDAWRSGASSWTTARRQAFANDLSDPQLLAVDASDNESKGDRSPNEWMPPREAFWCTYAEMYTHTKFVFGLTVTSAERTALADMLGTC